MWWEHLLDWVQDQRVWEWVRTVLAALLGALIGGIFLLRGQTKAAEAQATRDEIARQNQLADARRKDTQDDARALFRAFVDLERDIADQPVSIRLKDEQRSTWIPIWQDIWTAERRSEFRVLGELIPEKEPREQIGTVVRFLNMAEEFSNESTDHWGTDLRLRHLVSGLAREGLATMSAYLRHDTYTFDRDSLWKPLEKGEALRNEFLESDG